LKLPEESLEFGILEAIFFKLVPKKAELETDGPATTEPFKLICNITVLHITKSSFNFLIYSKSFFSYQKNLV
jgi:hypothetical protein